MNKTIKKIVAFGVGASMLLGTTAAAVLAADLSAYPSPFVANGVFVGKIVIGEKAMSIDTVGALDIAASLQRAAVTSVSSSGAATQVEGGFRLDTNGERIYYGQGIKVDSVTKDNLAMLANGAFEDDEGTVYDYTQSLVFAGTETLGFNNQGESANDASLSFTTAYGSAVNTGTYLYKAKVDFTKALNTTSTLVKGNKIVLLGNEYTFSSESSGTTVVLYGSSEEISVGMGEEVTKNVNGKDWKIKVIGFSSTKVTIQVNGETYSIAQDATKTFGGANGLKVYAKSVDSWDGGNAGTTGFATLQLGAEKLTLESGQPVQTGSSNTEIDGTYVQLGGTASALTSIYVSVGAADSDFKYIAEGKSFTDPVFKTFKVSYPNNNIGLTDAGRDTIKVSESGSDKVTVTLPLIGGTAKTIYFNKAGVLKSDDKTINAIEGASAPERDWVYLAPADPKYTHLVEISNIRMNADGYAQFKDVLTGSDYESDHGAFLITGATRSLTVDGKQYVVTLSDNNSVTPKIAVTYADSQTVVFPEIELKNGETFFFTTNLTGLLIPDTTDLVFPGGQSGIVHTATVTSGVLFPTGTAGTSKLNYTMTVASNVTSIVPFIAKAAVNIKEKRDDGTNYNIVTIASNAGALSSVSAPVFTGTNSGLVSMADDKITAGLDYYGTYATYYQGDGDNDDTATLHFPTDQMYANLFISPLGAAISTSSTSGAVSLNPISLGLAILDSEASLGSKPYIVVGGPCVNTLAAALMGNPADCTTGFSEGKAMIKLFADKNALLVAGFNGRDTQAACRVVASYKDADYALSGTEMEVTTTNLQQPVLKKVSS